MFINHRRTDKAIDALVYELYGLTAEEIAIAEGGGRKQEIGDRRFHRKGASAQSLLTLNFQLSTRNYF